MEKSNNLQDLNEARKKLQNIEAEWVIFLDELKSSKNEKISTDLFAALEYLKCCDIFFKNSTIELKQLDEQLQGFSTLKKQQKNNDLESIDGLIAGFKRLKMSLENRLVDLEMEYTVLSEITLRKVQDVITKINETKSNNFSIKRELDQNLDKKLYLQELKDSLEDYRQAREEYISESMGEILKLPDNFIPEDLGEEVPEIDPILSQLDTVITECDSALLISDIGETE